MQMPRKTSYRDVTPNKAMQRTSRRVLSWLGRPTLRAAADLGC
jgi:hypothetical protein